MKALTVCQPFAHLIVHGGASGKKRVENRLWRTTYRGLVAIHAGKNRGWLDDPEDYRDDDPATVNYGIPLDRMAFGAVVGMAWLIECATLEDINAGKLDARFPWIREHEHTEGPWCWILGNAVALAEPVPCKGSLGLFELVVPGVELAISRDILRRHG